MAGFEFAGVCYQTTLQAQDAYFSQIQPFYNNTAGNATLQQWKYMLVNGVWKIQRNSINTTTGIHTLNVSVDPPLPTFRTCDVPNDPSSNFLQGQELGWAVATVMISVAVIRMIYRR